MDSTKDFHTWLQQQQKEGAFASEGAFSLKQERSWEKLGAFQLPFAEAWVLKLIQGAVALGAEEIRVSQTWRESEFVFEGGREITPEDVEAAVFETPEYLPPGLKTLGIAVRALGKGSKHPFCLGFKGGVGQAWTGKKFVSRKLGLRENFSVVVSHFEFGSSILDMWSLPGDELRRKMVAISHTLTGQCYPCPARLLLDGRQLNGPHNDPVFGMTTLVRPLATMGVRSEELPVFPMVVGRELGVCKISDLQIESGFDRFDVGSRVEHSALLVVSAFLENERQIGRLRNRPQFAELLWVVDGVVTQRERLEWKGPVSFALLVSAADLETDLTGLALRETDSYLQRRERVLSVIARKVRGQKDWSEDGTLRFYSNHPFTRLWEWAEQKLRGLLSRRVPPESIRISPYALERRSLELEEAFKAAVSHLAGRSENPRLDTSPRRSFS